MTAIRVAVLSDLEASVNAVRDRQAQLDADGLSVSFFHVLIYCLLTSLEDLA